jgi:WD40 repeat protein/predicted Ser/Thr protein kinase
MPMDPMTTTQSGQRCGNCGATLDPNRAEGLCPRCAWVSLTQLDDARVNGHSLLGISGLEVLEEIARGGMGIVYLARQFEPDRLVALKMLLPHQVSREGMRHRFGLEIQAIAGLEHPSILPVYQVGEHDQLPYFTMKYASGGTLSQKKEELSGDWRAIAELMARLAEAVQFSHERGVLHRDLKPGNILFDEEQRAYVSDFGLAKLASSESDLTRSADMLGTPHYLAPEIAAGGARDATIASDVYSLGAILYELLAGQPPFDARSVPALLKKISEADPLPPSVAWKGKGGGDWDSRPPRSGVPRDLEVIALKSLAKEPSRRYRSAGEFAADLRLWLAGRTILGRAPTRLERIRAWTRRNPALAVMIALLALVLMSFGIIQVRAGNMLKKALLESLLAQSQMNRATGSSGQRINTLALVQRAVKFLPQGSDSEDQARLAALRTEAVGALSLPDLRPLSRRAVTITHYENEFDFNSDLSCFVVAKTNGGFSVIETETGKALWGREGQGARPGVEFRLSGNGQWVAAGYENGQVELHHSPGTEPPRTWTGQPGQSRILVFSSKSDRFAVGSSTSDGRPEIEVINLEDGSPVANLVLEKPALVAAFRPDASQLVIGSDAIKAWNIAMGKFIWSAPLSHSPSVISWSPDGKEIAVALDRRLQQGSVNLSADPIMLFDASSGRQQSLFGVQTERVEQLAFHPDGHSLAAAGWSGEMIWGSLDPKGFRLRTAAAQRTLRFSADGKRLAYAPDREQLGVLEVDQPRLFHQWEFRDPPERSSFNLATSPNGKWLAAGSQSTLRIWDIHGERLVTSLKLPPNAWYMTILFSPDSSSIYYSALSFGVRHFDLAESGSRDGASGLQIEHDHEIHGPGFMAIGYASDGRSLIVGETKRASGDWAHPITLWLWPNGDASRGRKLAENFPLVGYRAVAGGEWAVSTDLVEPDLWIWNFKTGERIRSLGISGTVSSELAANGLWLVTKAQEHFAVWKTGSWQKISEWKGMNEAASNTLISSSDSKLLATSAADGRLVLRRLPRGAEIVTLTPSRRLNPIDWIFSRDNSRLFMMTQTGQIWTWDLAGMRSELARFGLDWE